MQMYDTYYYGMGEEFMNKRQKVSREYLLDKAVASRLQAKWYIDTETGVNHG